ncbi:MAG: alpha/beta fold hydrolase [Gammaproteobacteria bacterium]|nr:alpha/beta fold hydrolase [Gammaproteobacteria bacterium]
MSGLHILGALLSLVVIYLLLRTAIRHAYRAPQRVEQGTPADFGLTYRTVAITTANRKRLFAWYLPPKTTATPAPAVVVMHGWGGNAELMLPFARQLYQAGYAVLLPDARNHGQSDGDGFSSMPRFAEDMEHAFDWLASQPEVNPPQIALLGHSVGAAAALLLASRRNDVAAVVSIAAFAHPETLMRRQMQANHIPYRPIGWVVLRYIERAIGHRFDAIAPANTIRKIRCPVLLVHGDNDRSVPHADAELIHAGSENGKVELLTLAGADHDSIEHVDAHGGKLIDFLRRAVG